MTSHFSMVIFQNTPATLTYTSHVPFNRPGELSLTGQMATFKKLTSSQSGAAANGRQKTFSSRGDHWEFAPASDVSVVVRGEQKFDGEAQTQQSGVPQEEGRRMRLVLSLLAPKAREWNVYRLRMRPGESNLDLPEWTREWSTDDDSTEKNANKTYLLRLLVGTMESAITQERVCGDWVLRVGGEE